VYEPRAGKGDLPSSPPPKQVQPKACRSAFMCFTDAKKKEILAEKNVHENEDILKIVARAWRGLTSKERAYWDEEARNDKLRYVFILSNLVTVSG
jgi:hypothetical protein